MATSARQPTSWDEIQGSIKGQYWLLERLGETAKCGGERKREKKKKTNRKISHKSEGKIRENGRTSDVQDLQDKKYSTEQMK